MEGKTIICRMDLSCVFGHLGMGGIGKILRLMSSRSFNVVFKPKFQSLHTQCKVRGQPKNDGCNLRIRCPSQDVLIA